MVVLAHKARRSLLLYCHPQPQQQQKQQQQHWQVLLLRLLPCVSWVSLQVVGLLLLLHS